MGKDTLAMKAVIGQEALSPDDLLFLQFLEEYEGRFLTQGAYESRDIFNSLDKAWELLRIFPIKKLNKISPDIAKTYFERKEKVDAIKKEEHDEKHARWSFLCPT